MLCNSVKDLSKINKDDYLFELKQDGCRAMLHLNEKSTSIFNRNKVNITDKYPELKSIIVSLFRCVLDGEIVILKNNSYECDFNAILSRENLSDRFKINLLSKQNPVVFFCFDAVVLNGRDISNFPLIKRKDLIRKYLERYENESFKILPYFNKLEIALDVMKHNNSEGLVLKKKDSKYLFNVRSNNWLKFKKRTEQIIQFDKFEENPDDSITLCSDIHNHRVKCCQLEAKNLIDKFGFVNAEVEGLEITTDNKIRFPILKRLI